MNIYNTYLNAKQVLNSKKGVSSNDGFKRIFSNGAIKDGKSNCSEVRTEPYAKKPFKGNSYSEEKPRWFKEEDESTKEEKVEDSESKDPENTSDNNTQKEQTTTNENNNQENINNDVKETEDKALNTVLEDINQLIDEASSKLDGPFTYGSMADYLSEVITKSLLLLAIDENTNQNNDSTTQQQNNNEESSEKEINISDNGNEAQSQPKEENKEN